MLRGLKLHLKNIDIINEKYLIKHPFQVCEAQGSPSVINFHA